MQIYNLFYREYWKEIYEDTHLGCFSTPDKAVAYAQMLEGRETPSEKHPFTAYYVYEDGLDPTEKEPMVGSILFAMDGRARKIFFRREEMGCSSLYPPGYNPVDFPSIAGK